MDWQPIDAVGQVTEPSIAGELGLSWEGVWVIVITAIGIYVAVVAMTRALGQRQLSQWSTYDLLFIFALGSLMGRAILVEVSLTGAVLGAAVMFLLHFATIWAHHHWDRVHELTETKPTLLVAHGQLLTGNLRDTHVSEEEVYEQLRLKGIASLGDVRAVVFERNGTMSVIPTGKTVDLEVFEPVVDGARAVRSGGAPPFSDRA